jgi:hypothetical protein
VWWPWHSVDGIRTLRCASSLRLAATQDVPVPAVLTVALRSRASMVSRAKRVSKRAGWQDQDVGAESRPSICTLTTLGRNSGCFPVPAVLTVALRSRASMVSRVKPVSKRAGWQDQDVGAESHPSMRVVTSFGRYSGCSPLLSLEWALPVRVVGNDD